MPNEWFLSRDRCSIHFERSQRAPSLLRAIDNDVALPFSPKNTQQFWYLQWYERHRDMCCFNRKGENHHFQPFLDFIQNNLKLLLWVLNIRNSIQHSSHCTEIVPDFGSDQKELTGIPNKTFQWFHIRLRIISGWLSLTLRSINIGADFVILRL